ncbi:hypothetical protein BGX26_008840 [Mortierella sp. AD094]|nr:hypothetical protein BGX26_008840 [Mortierella sp. AD094]
MESFRIQSSPTSSTSPTIHPNPQSNGAPQGRGEPLEKSSPEPIARAPQAPQAVPDPIDDSIYNHTKLIIESQYSDGVSGDGREYPNMNEDNVKGLAYCDGRTNQGHALAQHRLRSMIEVPQSAKHDCSKIAPRYQEPAGQGYAGAQCNLGFVYKIGRGMTQDYTKTLEWYQMATDRGHVYVQCCLGFMYNSGVANKQDYLRAMALYRIAADRGYDR